MINRLLATILSAINALLAIAIILVGGSAGHAYASSMGTSEGVGVAIGLVAGLLGAVMVCGLLAVLLDIRAELRELVALGRHNQTRVVTTQSP
jgi:hypothetical protein